jgi:hypothetical protein
MNQFWVIRYRTPKGKITLYLASPGVWEHSARRALKFQTEESANEYLKELKTAFVYEVVPMDIDLGGEL